MTLSAAFGGVVPDIQFESDRDANWLKTIVRRTGRTVISDRAEKAGIGEDNAVVEEGEADIGTKKANIDKENTASHIASRLKPLRTGVAVFDIISPSCG